MTNENITASTTHIQSIMNGITMPPARNINSYTIVQPNRLTHATSPPATPPFTVKQTNKLRRANMDLIRVAASGMRIYIAICNFDSKNRK